MTFGVALMLKYQPQSPVCRAVHLVRGLSHGDVGIACREVLLRVERRLLESLPAEEALSRHDPAVHSSPSSASAAGTALSSAVTP